MVKKRSYANRGMKLEKLINQTNVIYSKNGIAAIKKVPTNVKIISNKMGKVTGFTQKGELCDYVGVYKGRAVHFDAKETKGKSLPLDNIHLGQLQTLKEWHLNGAYCFVLVWFSDLDLYYVLELPYVIEAFDRYGSGVHGSKSIPLKTFEKYGKKIDKEVELGLNYIKVMEF